MKALDVTFDIYDNFTNRDLLTDRSNHSLKKQKEQPFRSFYSFQWVFKQKKFVSPLKTSLKHFFRQFLFNFCSFVLNLFVHLSRIYVYWFLTETQLAYYHQQKIEQINVHHGV